MTTHRKLAVLVGAFALMTAPAFAQAGEPPSNRGTAHKPAKPAKPGPRASAESKAKAYGKHCQGQSKKHVKGEKGTAFSRCVTAMAKLATGETKSPRSACKGLSKKKAAGETRSAFSKCVSEGAKLLREERA